jgi:hypothetical protein
MAKKSLTPRQIQEINERRRARFAREMRVSRTEDVLRRIASAYDLASDYIQIGKSDREAMQLALEKQGLPNYTINGRIITYRQAAVIYDLVRTKKYCEFPRPQPIAIFQPLSIRYKFPDPVEFLPSGRQTSEEYLKDYERGLMED